MNHIDPCPSHSRAGKTGPLYKRLVCPSCRQKTDFYYAGTQRWPERVAQLLGKSTTTTLWYCANCRTTLSFED